VKRIENIEDKIILGLIVLIAIVIILWILSGCAGKTASVIQLDYSSGCHFRADGLSAMEAEKITQEWSFTDCEMQLDRDIENVPKKG
jgi:hypothetical protein